MKKKLLFVITALAVCISANMVKAQQSLPVSGKFYKIKNVNSETYIGGTGKGAGNVVHEVDETNTEYHILRVFGRFFRVKISVNSLGN